MLGIISAMIFALTGCGKTTINLNKYISISAEGYDSMGKAKYSFDSEALMRDYSGKISLTQEGKREYGGFEGSGDIILEELMESCVDVNLDKTSGLSNGDVVTLKWNCKDETADRIFNTKFSYSDITYTVNGLKKVEGKFNPFDYVTVSFSGTSPKASIKITPDNNKEEMQYIEFRPNKKNDLKVGDSVTVTASISGSIDAFVQKFGTVLEKTEETYTVDGLDSYISDINDIPKDKYNEMDGHLRDIFTKAIEWDSDESTSLDLIGNYFLTLKEGKGGSVNNYLYYFYKVTYSNDRTKDYTYYWYGYCKDAMLSKDGEFKVYSQDSLPYYEVSSASNSMFGVHRGDYLTPDDSHYVAGFTDLDAFFNDQIAPKTDNYEYKSTITGKKQNASESNNSFSLVDADILIDGSYSSDDGYSDKYTAKISDDMKILTADTSWFHYDDTAREKIIDYPRKEYHIPISEKCAVESIYYMDSTTEPISSAINGLKNILGGLPITIEVKNGEIVKFTISS